MKLNTMQKLILVLYAISLVLLCIWWVPWMEVSRGGRGASEYAPVWAPPSGAAVVDTTRLVIVIIALTVFAAVVFILCSGDDVNRLFPRRIVTMLKGIRFFKTRKKVSASAPSAFHSANLEPKGTSEEAICPTAPATPRPRKRHLGRWAYILSATLLLASIGVLVYVGSLYYASSTGIGYLLGRLVGQLPWVALVAALISYAAFRKVAGSWFFVFSVLIAGLSSYQSAAMIREYVGYRRLANDLTRLGVHVLETDSLATLYEKRHRYGEAEPAIQWLYDAALTFDSIWVQIDDNFAWLNIDEMYNPQTLVSSGRAHCLLRVQVCLTVLDGCEKSMSDALLQTENSLNKLNCPPALKEGMVKGFSDSISSKRIAELFELERDLLQKYESFLDFMGQCNDKVVYSGGNLLFGNSSDLTRYKSLLNDIANAGSRLDLFCKRQQINLGNHLDQMVQDLR